MDSKVVESDAAEKVVVRHELPEGAPESPALLVKGIARIEGVHFVVSDGVVTWTPPISVRSLVELVEGEEVTWRWTGAGGDEAEPRPSAPSPEAGEREVVVAPETPAATREYVDPYPIPRPE